MGDNEFSITGIDELVQTFERIGRNVNSTKARALKEGAEIIKKEASQRCPRDNTARNLAKKYSPGKHLADNIIVSDVINNSYVEIGPQKGDNNDFYYGKNLPFMLEIA